MIRIADVYFPFLRGLAHELNNPLTGILGYSQLLALGSGGAGSITEELKEIEDCAVRCRDLVALLSRCSKPEEQPTSYSPERLFEDLVALVDPVAHRRGIVVEVRRAEGFPPLRGRPWLLRAGLLGLAGYALESLDGGGRLALRLRGDPPGARVEMSLGAADPEALRSALEGDHPPDPTRLAAPGTGRQVLEAEACQVDVEEVQGQASFVIRLR